MWSISSVYKLRLIFVHSSFIYHSNVLSSSYAGSLESMARLRVDYPSTLGIKAAGFILVSFHRNVIFSDQNSGGLVSIATQGEHNCLLTVIESDQVVCNSRAGRGTSGGHLLYDVLDVSSAPRDSTMHMRRWSYRLSSR